MMKFFRKKIDKYVGGIFSRHFQAAARNRFMSGFGLSYSTEDLILKSDLKILRARARDLSRNNDAAISHLRSLEVNVIGTGISFQSQIKLNGKNLDELNRKIENEFKLWSKANNCHCGGTLDFEDIEALLATSLDVDGEFIVQIIRKKFGKSKVPFALKIIDPDLLDEKYNETLQNNNEVRMGVEVDDWGRPVAYHFLQKHPHDINNGLSQSGRVRVPAEEIIHIFKPNRATGQTRGYTKFASVIIRLHQLNEYIKSTLIGKRIKSSIMGFIFSEDPDGYDGDKTDDSGNRLLELEPGKLMVLPPGHRVEVPNFGNESGAEAEPFITSQMRGVSAGTGSSYESISSDYSKSNYSSIRQALVNERAYWKIVQAFLIRKFHQKIFEQWLDMSVLSGVIQIQNYFGNEEKYNQVKWLPRGWSWVDPKSDVYAQKMAVDNGFKTITDVLSEEGRDFEETMLCKKKEIEFMKANGITLVGVQTQEPTSEEGVVNESKQ